MVMAELLDELTATAQPVMLMLAFPWFFKVPLELVSRARTQASVFEVRVATARVSTLMALSRNTPENSSATGRESTTSTA